MQAGEESVGSALLGAGVDAVVQPQLEGALALGAAALAALGTETPRPPRDRWRTMAFS